MPNYVVDPVNGADPNSGLTESTAWRTPQKARTTARSGDIVRLRGGNYTLSDNGACFRTGYHGLAGAPITFQAYSGEIPTLRNQPTGLVFEHNYISIKGFQFLNDAMRAGQFLKGVTAGANHHLVMEDCVIGNCSPGEPTWGVDWPDVSYGRISRCRIHHVGTPPQPGPESGNGLGVAGNHNLIEDCVVDFCGHAGTFFCGDHNILRRCEFIGTWGVPGENLREIHIPGRNLVEWCIFRNASYLEDGLYSDPSWQQMGSNMLLRFCLIYDGNGAMIQIYSRDDYPSKGCRFIHNVGYHNGFNSPYPPGTYELQKDTTGSQGDNIIKNSIHFKNKRDGASYAGQASAADIAFLSNTWNATDPLFVDEAARNFRLREGSPCIDAGEFLTRTWVGGSGQSIPVADAAYFCDGWGIVEGDYIQLEGTDYCTKILSIDYANNVLNLADSLTWSAGQGVSLPFIGTKPDIGAFEYLGDVLPSPTIYYVRIDGNDLASGKSDAEAWKTKSRVNTQVLAPNEQVLFKRGNVWMGEPLSPISGIFGAYGEGDSPRFDMSIRRNAEADWTLESSNLWYATSGTSEICNLIMDDEAIIGIRKTTKVLCTAQGDWWWDSANHRIYFYSAGNPGVFYNYDIICAQKLPGVLVDCTVADRNNLIFRDIDVYYSGFHPFHVDGHSHNPDNILFERCRGFWFGGYSAGGSDRGGNLIELWGRGTNIEARYCVGYQGYDFLAAVESDRDSAIFDNINIHHCLSYKCGDGFGMFHNKVTGILHGIHVDHNTFADGEGAWSSLVRADSWWRCGFATSDCPSANSDLSFTNNIIYKFPYLALWLYEKNPPDAALTVDNNCYFKTAGDLIRWKTVNFTTAQFANYQTISGKDVSSIAADPLFLDPTNGDFHLTKDSPCIGIDAGAFKYIGEIMATHSIDVILRVLELADFAMGATPADLSVQRTKTGTYSVTATAVGGFASAITLSVSGVPTNATFSFSKNPILPGETSIFSITPATNTPLGNFTLTFTGNG